MCLSLPLLCLKPDHVRFSAVGPAHRLGFTFSATFSFQFALKLQESMFGWEWAVPEVSSDWSVAQTPAPTVSSPNYTCLHNCSHALNFMTFFFI